MTCEQEAIWETERLLVKVKRGRTRRSRSRSWSARSGQESVACVPVTKCTLTGGAGGEEVGGGGRGAESLASVDEGGNGGMTHPEA